MSSNEFKVGDRVRCISDNLKKGQLLGKIGKIINTDYSLSFPYLVEFLEPINGHSGYNRKGKDGYCWNFDEDELELYQPILKLFLKEKENE